MSTDIIVTTTRRLEDGSGWVVTTRSQASQAPAVRVESHRPPPLNATQETARRQRLTRWDLEELDALVAEEDARLKAERARKLAELVTPVTYTGKLCRLPGEANRSYKKRVNKATRVKTPGSMGRAWLAEVDKQRQAGYLTESQARTLRGMDDGPADGTWPALPR